MKLATTLAADIALTAVLTGCDGTLEQAAVSPKPCIDQFMNRLSPVVKGRMKARHTVDISKADRAVKKAIFDQGLNGQKPSVIIAVNGPLKLVETKQIEGQAAGGVVVQSSDAALYIFEEPAFEQSAMRTEVASKCDTLSPGVTLRSVQLTNVDPLALPSS
jgi:hypothetical protein